MIRTVTSEQVRRYHYASLCCQIIKKLDHIIFNEPDYGRVFSTERMMDLDNQPLHARYIIAETFDDEWRNQVLRDNYTISLPALERQLLRPNTNFVRTTHAAKVACVLVRERYLHHHPRLFPDLRTNAWVFTGIGFTVEERATIARIFREQAIGDYFTETRKLKKMNELQAEDRERLMRIRIDAEITSIAIAVTRTMTSLMSDPKLLTGNSGA